MADKCCWCGKALMLLPCGDAEPGTDVERYLGCPIHGEDWQRPPEGLVPALVAAVRAVLTVLERIPSADHIEDVIADGGAAYGHNLAVAMSRTMELMTAALAAFAALDRPGEEARDD